MPKIKRILASIFLAIGAVSFIVATWIDKDFTNIMLLEAVSRVEAKHAQAR